MFSKIRNTYLENESMITAPTLMLIGGIILLVAFLSGLANMMFMFNSDDGDKGFVVHLILMGLSAIGSFSFLGGLIWFIIQKVG